MTTKADLIEALEASGVPVPADATKADLEGLLADVAATTSPDPSPPLSRGSGEVRHLTRRQARGY